MGEKQYVARQSQGILRAEINGIEFSAGKDI